MLCYKKYWLILKWPRDLSKIPKIRWTRFRWTKIRRTSFGWNFQPFLKFFGSWSWFKNQDTPNFKGFLMVYILFTIFWSGTKRVYTLRPSEATRAPLTGIFYQNENIFENYGKFAIYPQIFMFRFIPWYFFISLKKTTIFPDNPVNLVHQPLQVSHWTVNNLRKNSNLYLIIIFSRLNNDFCSNFEFNINIMYIIQITWMTKKIVYGTSIKRFHILCSSQHLY